MRKLIVGVALIAASVTCHAAGVIPIPSGVFWSGNDYMKRADMVRLPYLEGALDGLLTAGLGLKGMQRLGNCTGQMQLVGGQLLAIVNQYMQAHPEEWGDAMPSIIFSALSDACKKIGAPIN